MDAAPQVGGFEACAEFQAPDGGNAEDDLGDAVFQSAEHGVAPAGGQAHGGALDDAAHGVQLPLGPEDGGLHFPGGAVPEHREGLLQQGAELGGIHGHRVEPAVLHVFKGLDVGRHGDSLGLQQLQADPAGDAQGSRQPAGEVAAAGHVLEPAVADLGREVGMAGPGAVPQVVVVSGAGVGVADEGRQGRAAGDVSHQSGDELRQVGLLPGRGRGGVPRRPAGKERPQPVHIDSKPGGNPLDGHADGRGMGLAENGEAKPLAVGTAHGINPSCK